MAHPIASAFSRARAYVTRTARAWSGQARRAFETRASAVGRLIFVATGGQIRRTEVKFEDLAKEGYQQNPVVYRCIRMIADALKSMPVQTFVGEQEQKPEHPIAMLLSSPNPDQIWEELVDAIVGHMVLAGECFLEGVQLGRGAVVEINALRPDKMNPKPAPDGTVAAYVYEGQGGNVTFDIDPNPLKFRPILHIKNWNPVDQWRGQPAMMAAASAADEHNGAVSYAKALLTNSARPSGAMVYEPKEGPASLGDDEYERLKAELDEQHQGAGNAGRPMLLDGGLKWEQMGLSPKDLESGEGRAAAAREIAFALGVPPLLLGLPGDNTFANYEEANLAFWRFTVFPLAVLLQKKLTAWLRPLVANLSIKFDAESSPIAEAEKKIRWDRVRLADFITLDEKRKELGFDPLPNGQGQHVMVAISLAPLDQVLNRPPPGATAPGYLPANEPSATVQ